MCVKLLWYSRPDIQISISARVSEGIRSNIDACEGLSCFVGWCRRSVWQCMWRGDKNISRWAVMVSSMWPHPFSLVELRGQIVMFSEMWGVLMNVVKKYSACWWYTYVKNSSEMNMVDFHGRFLWKNVCRCIFVCIIVWYFTRNQVAWDGLFGLCVCNLRKEAGDFKSSGYSFL